MAKQSAGMHHCKATSKAGQPCKSPAMRGSDYCYTHDPANAERRNASRRNGGKARHGKLSNVDKSAVTLATPADVLTLTVRTINDVLSLDNSIARAKAIASLATVALKVMQADDLEKRIAALELQLQLRATT